MLIATLFSRLKEASETGRPFSMILGNPEPDTYIPLAQLINYFQVDCSKVSLFAEDEWADLILVDYKMNVKTVLLRGAVQE